jgi:hypothetical protein
MLPKKTRFTKRRFTRSTVKRTTSFRRPYRRPNTRSLAAKVSALSKQIKIQKPESMHITTPHNGTFALTSGVGVNGYYLDQVAYPGSGDDQFQRHGRDIRATSIVWKGYIGLPASFTDSAIVTLMIVKDMKVGDGVYGGFRISSLFNLDSKNKYSPHSLRNTDFYKDFRIIAYHRFHIKRNASDSADRVPFNIVRRLRDVVEYSNNGTNPTSPPMFLLAMCDTGDVGAGTGCDIYSMARLFYFDS